MNGNLACGSKEAIILFRWRGSLTLLIGFFVPAAFSRQLPEPILRNVY